MAADTSYNDIKCPFCQSSDWQFTRCPKHTREWQATDEDDSPGDYREYWGPVRNYACGNCDCEWSMPEDIFHD